MTQRIDRRSALRMAGAGFLGAGFAGAGILGAGVWGAAPSAAEAAPAQKDGLIERRESQYNTIYVVRDAGLIKMLFGVNRDLYTESAYNPARPRELVVSYTQYMTLAAAYTGEPASVMEIGLGGGRTITYLHDFFPRARLSVAELDPDVIAMAQKHFDVRPDARLAISQMDGRIALNRAKDQYDVILVDAYRGSFVPFHLTTKEFFQLVKRRLRPGGAAVQNIADPGLFQNRAIATIKSVFANLDLYATPGGNLVAIAYDGPAKTDAQLRATAQALQQTHRFTHPLTDMLRLREPVRTPAGQPLTDDFAPVEMLRAIDRYNTRPR